MKTFLVATDFSPASQRAAEYAAQLAQPLGASLLLCHVVATPVILEPQALDLSAASAAMVDPTASDGELRRLAADLGCELQQRTGRAIPIDTVSLRGNVTEAVIALARERQAELVVVGVHNDAEFGSFLSGNHTASVLEHCRLPVLVVPANAPLREIRSILFACDLADTDARHLDRLAQLAAQWGASLLVAHVTTNPAEIAKDTKRMNELIGRIPEPSLTGNISFRLIPGDSVSETLDRLIRRESVDLLAMSTRKRNFFQQLTHRSLSKRMAEDTQIPCLIFHSNRLADLWIL